MSVNSNSRGKGEVIGVEFRPAKGGVTSDTHMRYKRGGQGGGPMEDHEHEMAVHSTLESAHEHLTKTLGHSFPDADADEADRETKADKE